MFNLIRKLFQKKQPSLLALQIAWLNQASFLDRLQANQQLALWLANK
jgi:hypothetical protein